MCAIKLNIENTKDFISKEEIEALWPQVKTIHEAMESGDCPGSDFLGWLHLPSKTENSLIDDINAAAGDIRAKADVFISIGIGGSYLGAKAAIAFTGQTFSGHNSASPSTKDDKKSTQVYFAGQNISSDYLADLIDLIADKDVCLGVISKSGTTTEPAIAFRILKQKMEEKYGKEGARDRIIVTTDEKKGALKKLAHDEGYKSFIIPDDVGGRYSVLTPVGLLPVAVAGVDIAELMEGAKSFETVASDYQADRNPAYLYAAARYILHQKGKDIEMLSGFHPSLHYIGEWWKQLAGESEGKDGKGIFPASADMTTDLHSMGQWIQEGKRIIFETFLNIEQSKREIKIPQIDNDLDGLNYIAGKTLEFVNDKAYRGTAMAHLKGGVPNMTISIKDRSAATLGQLFYFFERAVAMTGYLMDVNPFDQPGVEFYKKNMFELLGKK
ncbi:MAG: glucose-6-phosphate isomerase [bacterium]|nr:glucose-6-phosphate isomerase [bacterium]